MTQWTEQQLAFFDFLQSTDASCVLQAKAGTGKTTTLVEGIKHLKGSILQTAFNTKIKKEFEAKIGDSAVCKTMNGLGHRALCNMFGGRISIDRDKNFKVVKEIMKDEPDSSKYAWSPVLQLLGRAKHSGLVPKSTPGNSWTAYLEDTPENWQDLADHHNIEFDPTILSLVRRALRLSNKMAWKKECDFDDQIYIPVCWNATFDKYDNVIVDEAQDLSVMQHRIVEKSVKHGGRIIAAGDIHQAIYGWRAAASDSIPQLIEKFHLEELDLTVSFRCGTRIIEEAQAIVPEIEARPDAHTGEVIRQGDWGAETFQHGDAILCRNNGPLIGTAYRLISAGVPIFVIGRDIGRGLKNLIKILQKRGANSASDLMMLAEEWKEVELARLHAANKFSQMQAVDDKATSLIAIITGSGAREIDEVILRIDELFSKKSGKVCLSTIHRAKGMEWPRVFFLDDELIPSYWTLKAVAQDPNRFQWMLQEEFNIRYVAVTRAIDQLTYVRSEDWT